jgi:hypothetical protein
LHIYIFRHLFSNPPSPLPSKTCPVYLHFITDLPSCLILLLRPSSLVSSFVAHPPSLAPCDSFATYLSSFFQSLIPVCTCSTKLIIVHFSIQCRNGKILFDS